MPRRTLQDPVAQGFGKAIKAAREQQGKTLESIAGAIHRQGPKGPTTMDSKYLLSLEGGWHSPTITTAKQIADALGVPLSDLVAGL